MSTSALSAPANPPIPPLPTWPPRYADGHGLHVAVTSAPDARQVDVRVTTSAVRGPDEIRILYPSGYDPHSSRRYPVLYLMHGAFGDPGDWIDKGGAEATSSGLPMFVVMPAIGINDDGGGSCTNWYAPGTSAPQQWETFHIDQVIPWIDQNLPTIATRGGRAIAGLSEGGLCAMTYAARHPDLFGTALSFSGADDIAYDRQNQAPALALTNLAAETNGGTSNSVYGDPASNEINWENHDPATLAPNLRAMNLWVYTGNGLPGPYDSTHTPDGLETDIAYDNLLFHNRLEGLHIANHLDNYGPGTHTWPYWARDLRWSIATVMSYFDHPPATPAKVNYTVADPSYRVYGWEITMHRTAMEFSTLKDAAADGFTLMGSGSGDVETPPVYAADTPYGVALHGHGTNQAITVRTDAQGRLHLKVPLGPPNPYQQDTPAGTASGTQVYSTQVKITPEPKASSTAPIGTRHSSPTCSRQSYVVLPTRVPKSAKLTVSINGHRVRSTWTSRGVRVALAGVKRGAYRLSLVVRTGHRVHRASYVVNNCRLQRRRR